MPGLSCVHIEQVEGGPFEQSRTVGVCGDLLGDGESCMRHEECALPLRCHRAGGEPGQCAPLREVGESCLGDDNLCESNRCDLDTKICLEPFPPNPPLVCDWQLQE